MRLLWVCFGGALGTGARLLVSNWTQERLGVAFPWGTLAVNALGSFLLGAIMVVATCTDLLSPTAKVTLTTGVMGGFTTYSTFNYETMRGLQSDWPWTGVLNVAVTVAGCLVAGFAGHALARWAVGD